MKTTTLSLLFLFFILNSQAQIIINEVQSSNNSTIQDNYGEYEDWIELFNSNDFEVDIAGLILKDNVDTWQIPSGDPITIMQPGTYFLLWADDEEVQGKFHTNFKLSASNGEYLGLYKSDGTTVIDSVTLPPLSADVSYGKCDTEWIIFNTPSPASENYCSGTALKGNGMDKDFFRTNISGNLLHIVINDFVSVPVNVKIYALNGVVLFRESFYSNYGEVELSKFKSGIYLLNVETEKNSGTIKIGVF
ncbi:lamin tail domain-containing protein [Saccharicrinis sp. FJH54]|uniref:lamin tail domain-containing protein n=1 Tax=Saccharicrinis sp. FJH54 TaxID=3344665 RepID=UPI0035D459D7